MASKRPVRHVFDNVSLKATIVTPFSLWQVSFMYKKIPPRFLLSNHSRFFTNFSTSFLFFYFSILLLLPRSGGKIKMGYLHMLAHLSSCVISWKQRKNRQFWKNYYIMEEFLGRISLILYVDNIETTKNKRNNVYFFIYRFLLSKYQSTKINLTISQISLFWIRSGSQNIPRATYRIKKNKKNSLKFCSIDFPHCANSRFPPFIFFRYRIELVRRNECPMNGSVVTKAYPRVRCDERRGGLLRETLPPLHGFNFSMYYITLISLRGLRMHPVSNTLIIRYERAVSVNSCYLYVTTSICGARAFIRVYRTKHPWNAY